MKIRHKKGEKNLVSLLKSPISPRFLRDLVQLYRSSFQLKKSSKKVRGPKG